MNFKGNTLHMFNMAGRQTRFINLSCTQNYKRSTEVTWIVESLAGTKWLMCF